MLSYLDNLYIKAAIKTRNFIDSFKNDERGVSTWTKITGKANEIG